FSTIAAAKAVQVKLDAEVQNNALYAALSATEVVVVEAAEVVAKADPDILNRAEAGHYPERVHAYVTVVTGQRAASHTNIPAPGNVIAVLSADQVGVSGEAGAINGVADIAGAILK